MAGKDPTQARVALASSFFVAPVGTTAPTATGTGWPAGWLDLGYLDTGGPPAEEHFNPTFKDFYGHGQLRPIRTNKTQETLEWVVRLIQKTGTNLKLAHGGGTITALSAGDSKYTLGSASNVDEHAFGMELVDGTVIDRYVLPRGLVVNVQPIVFRNDELERFDLTIRALAPAGVGDGGWDYIISNDPAMAT